MGGVSGMHTQSRALDWARLQRRCARSFVEEGAMRCQKCVARPYLARTERTIVADDANAVALPSAAHRRRLSSFGLSSTSNQLHCSTAHIQLAAIYRQEHLV
jgi:hypothetical protein